MLALRLTLCSGPLGLLLRFVLLATSAGIGLLLLAALAHAQQHPLRAGEAALRLLWCLLPLAAAAHLATALARTEPRTDTRLGLEAAGLGAGRLPRLSAATTALPCALGSALVSPAAAGSHGTLHLPGTGHRLPLPTEALPLPATLTLLSIVPLTAAVCAAWAVRPVRDPEHRAVPAGATRGGARRPAGRTVRHAGLLGGGALIVCGLALTGYAATLLPRASVSGAAGHGGLPRPGELSASPLAAGWLLAALGLVVAGPGLVSLTGRLLAVHRPGAVRLLAGRALQREAPHVGRALGLACAVGAALAALARVRLGAEGVRPLGPQAVLGVTLVACCAAGSALAALAGARRLRRAAARVLDGLGAPRALRRRVTLARTGVLGAVFALVLCGTAVLAALPLT